MSREVAEEDRVRSFLTKEDKQYLRGEKEYPEGSEYNVRRRIVERTRQALRDFRLVYSRMEDRDRDRVFHPRNREANMRKADRRTNAPDTPWSRRIQTWEELFVGEGCWCALAFIYEGVGEEEFEVMLTKALTHVLTGERDPGRAEPAVEGIRVGLEVEHVDTALASLMVQKIHNSGADSFTPIEQRALFHLLEGAGASVPEDIDDFNELYVDYIEQSDVEMEDAIPLNEAAFTLDPFQIVRRGELDETHPFDKMAEDMELAHEQAMEERDEEVKEWARNWKRPYPYRRGIGDETWTPNMSKEVIEEQGIDEIPPEDLRILFQGGYGKHEHVIYDGEKVIKRPPHPHAEGEAEPEVLYHVDPPNGGKET